VVVQLGSRQTLANGLFPAVVGLRFLT
jgi:hypothetical protein